MSVNEEADGLRLLILVLSSSASRAWQRFGKPRRTIESRA